MDSRRMIWVAVSVTVVPAVVLSLCGYVGAPVSSGGTVSGTVKLRGPAPAVAPILVTTARAVCGATVPNEQVVLGPGGALANVIVWLDGIASGAPARPRPVPLENNRCRFVPHVQTATIGSRLTVTSRDATLHNIHGRFGDRTAFNLALPMKGMHVQRRLTEAGRLRIQCDAGHTWMSAYLQVFDHPYHTVTGASGQYALRDVPPGTYTLKAWHERFGERSARVTVTADGTLASDVTFESR